MKKIIAIATFVSPLAVQGQSLYTFPGGETMSRQFLEIPAMLLVLYLAITFILSIIRSIMDYLMKSKLIEKGVPDNIIEQFLKPTNRDTKSQAMKWTLILAGVGIGLAIVSNNMPLGIHSLSIMAVSLSVSFLCYYFFIRQSEK